MLEGAVMCWYNCNLHWRLIQLKGYINCKASRSQVPLKAAMATRSVERTIFNLIRFVYVLIVLLPSATPWFLQERKRIALPITNTLKSYTPVDSANQFKIQQQDEFQFYDYDGAKISYRALFTNHLSGNQQKLQPSSLLLIHPIGIGQASWFWDRFISDWCKSSLERGSNYDIYTVNLLGCGVTTEKNASWNMTERTQQYASPEISDLPVSLPISLWVEQCETLLQRVIYRDRRTVNQSVKGKDKLENESEVITLNKVTLIAQGGLASVAVMLAARNPSLIKHMILTSPPTYNDLTTAIPESELRFNYHALCNQFLEKIAFSVLESRLAIKFFSNLFLFADPCDDEWLSKTINELGPAVRRPVQLFNAGYCFYRSYEEELSSIILQPTLILRGYDDSRDFDEFKTRLEKCTTKKINGKNVLPWESSIECCSAIEEFMNEND